MWQLKYLTSHCTVHNKSHGGEDDTSFFLCSFGRFSSAGCACMSSRYTRMHFYPIIMCTSLCKPLQRGAEHSSGEEAGRKACNNTDPLQRSHSCILRMHTNTVHKQSRARGGAVAGLCCCSTARRRFQPSLLCHLCVVPEFATGGCCINSWITAFLIS